jgi:hypothetical protein
MMYSTSKKAHAKRQLVHDSLLDAAYEDEVLDFGFGPEDDEDDPCMNTFDDLDDQVHYSWRTLTYMEERLDKKYNLAEWLVDEDTWQACEAERVLIDEAWSACEEGRLHIELERQRQLAWAKEAETQLLQQELGDVEYFAGQDEDVAQYFAGPRTMVVDLGDGTVAVVSLVGVDVDVDSAAAQPLTCKVLQSFTAPGACSRGAPSLFDIVAKQHGDVYQAARSAYAIP